MATVVVELVVVAVVVVAEVVPSAERGVAGVAVLAGVTADFVVVVEADEDAAVVAASERAFGKRNRPLTTAVTNPKLKIISSKHGNHLVTKK